MGLIFVEESRRFLLTTANTAYCLGIDREGHLQQIYWGRKLFGPDDYPGCRRIGKTIGIGKNLENPRNLSLDDFYYPYEAGNAVINEEYPGWGGLNFVEPCLKVIFPDGVRDLVLRYHEHRMDEAGGGLMITLRDAHYPLFVHLGYSICEAADIIVRRAEIENRSAGAVRLESVQSAVWYPPDGRQYRLSQLTGRWANEFNLRQTQLNQGKTILESRRGITSHHAAPWFALDPGGESTEDAGEVWFGALAWSGNWKITAECTSNKQTRITGGLNDFDFAWELAPGEVFATPEFIGGYTGEGLGAASRLLHRYALARVYPERRRSQAWPVFYNTWETYWFDLDEQKLMALAEKAADLGVEVFHVDDGWFGGRRDEYSGLGDWHVNRQKFPRGLGPLVDKVRSLGMAFSLWIEPENVNVNSELFRAHPDWVYGFPTRSPSIQRESLILNLGLPVVREYIWSSLSTLIKEYGVNHFKWDLNRHFSEPGWSGLPADRQKELWVRHIRGVYEIKARLKREFPGTTIECCSGGGGRVDYGMLKYCEIALASDNHDPLSRLLIQEGYSYAYPAKTMGSWVTDIPSPLTNRNAPAEFMFHMAMTGAMGIQANILRWSEEESRFAKAMIAMYKEIRPIVQEGEVYRLNSLRNGHIMAVQYVDQSRKDSVVFVFMLTSCAVDVPVTNIIRWGSPRFLHMIHPRGLEPGRLYLIDGKGAPRSGLSLLHAGLEVELEGEYSSRLIRIAAAP